MIQRHDSLIVQTVSRFLTPLIQLFALYVLFHGHYSPGGGFQAGVLIGGSLILMTLVESRKNAPTFELSAEIVTVCLGLGFFVVIGGLSLLYQGSFFDYGTLQILSDNDAQRRYWAILIAECGVTLVVAMTLVIIFHVLALSKHSNEDNRD